MHDNQHNYSIETVKEQTMSKLICRFVMWLMHTRYVKIGEPIFYIRGVGKDYPKYLLYTEDETVYRRMDKF